MRDEIPIEVYRPYRQLEFATGITVNVRTTHNPEDIFSSINKRIHDLDSNLPVIDMVTLEGQVQDSLVTERLIATLSTGFGLLCHVVGCHWALWRHGLHGDAAHARDRNSHSFGAAKWDVLWLIMREALGLLSIGVVIALPVSWMLAQSVRSQLCGIQPSDPASAAIATLAIASVAILSGYLPARRAPEWILFRPFATSNHCVRLFGSAGLFSEYDGSA